MKPYPKYKPTNIEWIGEIPENWQYIPIKYLVQIKVTDGPHETPEFLDEGIPFISAESIKESKIDFNYKRGYISKEQHLEYSKKCLPKVDDVFFVKSGSTTGKIAIVEEDIEFNIWSPLALIRCNSKLIYPRFAYISMQSLYFQTDIQQSWTFGTQPNIGMGVIENLRIFLPPLPEQQAIVTYLDQKTALIDELIAKKERKIELLKENRTALINHAVTKGLDPTVKYKDSGIEWIGEIPEHWTRSKIKFISTLQGRIGFKGYTVGDLVDEGEGALTLGAKHISKNNVLNLSNPEYISWAKYYESPEIMVEIGDVLLTQRGSLGKVAIIDKEIGAATINPSMVILKKLKSESKFVYYLFHSDYVMRLIDLANTATAVPMISQNQLENFIILIPPILEQKAIVGYLENQTSLIDQNISLELQKIEKLKEYRQSLISNVVTGKICVLEA